MFTIERTFGACRQRRAARVDDHTLGGDLRPGRRQSDRAAIHIDGESHVRRIVCRESTPELCGTQFRAVVHGNHQIIRRGIVRAQRKTAQGRTPEASHVLDEELAALTAARRAKATGKALILALHVPVHAETLAEDTVRVWRQELTIGEGAFGADDPATMAFYNAVAVESDLAPDIVIAGHVHFDHEDLFPNGTPQYITDIACDGHCRVLTLTPN